MIAYPVFWRNEKLDGEFQLIWGIYWLDNNENIISIDWFLTAKERDRFLIKNNPRIKQ
tara:strand:- start:4347 stop:4520 length:174 start_codon:yes stop_codon:yes gene_type:complete